jgi:hypothetical protein
MKLQDAAGNIGNDAARQVLLEQFISKSLDLLYPADGDKNAQFRFIKSVIDDISPFDYEDDTHMKCQVGDEVIRLIAQEKKNKKARPLLSILCGHVRKEDAERLIGRSISTREYTEARKHRKHPGPGAPLEGEFLKFHRQRIKERSIEEFVEWLNAAGLLQNLAFGEKIVKFHNGFHCAIESVKRTESILQIVKLYYRHFLERREDPNDDESNTVDGDELDEGDRFDAADDEKDERDYYSDDDGGAEDRYVDDELDEGDRFNAADDEKDERDYYFDDGGGAEDSCVYDELDKGDIFDAADNEKDERDAAEDNSSSHGKKMSPPCVFMPRRTT